MNDDVPTLSEEPAYGRQGAGGVIAVDRALSILDALLAAREPLTLTELSAATGLVKPTVLRSLTSLERASYVFRTDDRRYSLGAKAAQLGASYVQSFKMDAVVLPSLKQLTADTQESSSFSILQAGKRVCLFRVESPLPVREVVESNVTYVLDHSSTSTVLTTNPAELISQSERIIYFSSGVNNPHVASLATPIFNHAGLAGAMTVSGPVQRIKSDTINRFATSLSENADQLSASWGGRSFQGAYQIVKLFSD